MEALSLYLWIFEGDFEGNQLLDASISWTEASEHQWTHQTASTISNMQLASPYLGIIALNPDTSAPYVVSSLY